MHALTADIERMDHAVPALRQQFAQLTTAHVTLQRDGKLMAS